MRLANVAVVAAVVLTGVKNDRTPGRQPQANGGSAEGRTAQSRVVEVPSAGLLYSNGLRDVTSGKNELARQEFQDYLKYYGDTALASNARFYLGEIAYSQANYQGAVNEYSRLLMDYPKSLRIVAARYKKGLALLELGQGSAGIRELREVIRRYPGTEEEHGARAKLQELGIVP